MRPLLEAKDLTKRYGSVVALDKAAFQVSEGITGLLGQNGAGKSTAIKLFLGLLRPTAGSAEVMGQHPYEALEARSRLGYMPEHDCLPRSVAATEFVIHMAQISGLPPAQARTRAADILRLVGLDEEAVPADRRVFDGDGPAREAGAGAGARSCPRTAGRADGGPRPGGPGGDADADRPHRAGSSASASCSPPT